MKTVFAAGALVLSLTVLPGCSDRSTVGGGSESGQKKPIYGEADNTFELSVPSNLPYPTSVKQGETTAFSVSAKRGKNFDQDVALTFEGLPTGVTVDPARAMIKHGDADAKVTLKAAEDAAVGTFTIKAIGTPTKGGAAASEFKITVSANKKGSNFSISVPFLSTHVKQGATQEVSIGVKRDQGVDEDIALKFDALPPGLSIDPANPTIKHGETEAKVTLKAATDAALGDKTIKVIGHPTKGPDAQQELKVTVETK